MDDRLPLPHRLTLNERSKLTLTGVTEVLSFDDTAAIVQTTMGRLTVLGEGLQLKNLSADGGQVAVEGTVSALSYEQTRKGGFFSRLVK